MNNELMNIISTVEIDSVKDALNKVVNFQDTVKRMLKVGHDFGEIPGTSKPTLLKPGAEKILMLLGLTSEYEIVDQIEDWNKGVFSYTIRCILSQNGMKITEGLGNCNSKEEKYRYRWVYERQIPEGIDKTFLKQNNGRYRIENEEPYTMVNTILKMAKKRAQVDATLTVASLSEIFTQDIEDMDKFTQDEAVETMTSNDASDIVISFGKYKGLTMQEIYKKEPSYIEWLERNARDRAVKKAAALLLNEQPAGGKEELDPPQDDSFYANIPEEDIPDMFKEQ